MPRNPATVGPSRWPLVCRHAGLCLVLLVVLALAPTGVMAEAGPSPDASPPAPRAVFEHVADGWEAGNARALSALVHRDGLRVTGGAGDSVGRYSPSQAYYYFKNLFRSHRTVLFAFRMMQDDGEGERVHAMATWKRRRVDSEKIEEFKVVCVLAREGDLWRLAELNTIR